MIDNKALAYFQEQLVDLLLKDLPPEEIVTQLKSNALLAPFHSYIDTYDMTMLRVASEIVKKWTTVNQDTTKLNEINNS